MLLENYKYAVKEILSDNSYNDDSNEENSDGTYEENSDEKTLMKKIKYINLFFEKNTINFYFPDFASFLLKYKKNFFRKNIRNFFRASFFVF